MKASAVKPPLVVRCQGSIYLFSRSDGKWLASFMRTPGHETKTGWCKDRVSALEKIMEMIF